MSVIKILADRDFVTEAMPTNVSELANDSGYLTSYTEIDPTVPSWAKESEKPKYDASEVGADPSGSADAALAVANQYTDNRIASLINSAPTTLDTLGEIAVVIEENADVVELLNSAIGSKANNSDLSAHTANKANPHNVTMSQLNLTSETWTFTLQDGTQVTKKVVLA